MSLILSMLSGILLRACISLALRIDRHLLSVEVRPTIPLAPCSKAFPPYLKAQQTQMQMFKVDRKRGISGPSSVRLTSTVQNSHLKIRSLITSITMFTTIITAHGSPVLDHRAVDRRSLQLAGYGLGTVPLHLRTTEP